MARTRSHRNLDKEPDSSDTMNINHNEKRRKRKRTHIKEVSDSPSTSSGSSSCSSSTRSRAHSGSTRSRAHSGSTRSRSTHSSSTRSRSTHSGSTRSRTGPGSNTPRPKNPSTGSGAGSGSSSGSGDEAVESGSSSDSADSADSAEVIDKDDSGSEVSGSSDPSDHESESLNSKSQASEDSSGSNSLDDFIIPDGADQEKIGPEQNNFAQELLAILMTSFPPTNFGHYSDDDSDGPVRDYNPEISDDWDDSDPENDSLDRLNNNHLDRDRPNRYHKKRKHHGLQSPSQTRVTNDRLSSELDQEHDFEKIKKRRKECLSHRLIYRDLPQIRNLNDLIAEGKKWQYCENEVWPIDMFSLRRLVVPLEKLQAMIGMNSVKNTLLKQLLTILGGFSTHLDMVHCVIEGPPGCGKTTVAMILSEIYQALGYANGTFITAKRSDLVAAYLGQTALKTQKVINEALGGVLFIDEAYSLGTKDQIDSYAKEAVDTLNQNLSEKAGNLICIIAGYEKELDENFFSLNPGLKRRFRYRHTIEKYTPEELRLIFLKKVSERPGGWKCPSNAANPAFFKTNYKYFAYAGGDMESLLEMSILCHTFRVFGKHSEPRKILTREDIRGGFKIFTENKEVRARVEDSDGPPPQMYL